MSEIENLPRRTSVGIETLIIVGIPLRSDVLFDENLNVTPLAKTIFGKEFKYGDFARTPSWTNVQCIAGVEPYLGLPFVAGILCARFTGEDKVFSIIASEITAAKGIVERKLNRTEHPLCRLIVITRPV